VRLRCDLSQDNVFLFRLNLCDHDRPGVFVGALSPDMAGCRSAERWQVFHMVAGGGHYRHVPCAGLEGNCEMYGHGCGMVSCPNGHYSSTNTLLV